ncbi:hypothetical protein Axy21_011 [Achromobacter phage vB_AxyP_19-32_Axy21]|uniref:Uncharacterized protein n=2 Tax=Axyvirus TaxID=3424993 RepID=A0A514CW32_9CAUD|nr:hypothetical protein Axy21_011 [Achromobacter phage vB_AxyP_19-32_Axy21]QDH84697.1 hypothetical protein Axy23_012 [Achromobacter phage vB_AxyP_19-32_Axy23]
MSINTRALGASRIIRRLAARLHILALNRVIRESMDRENAALLDSDSADDNVMEVYRAGKAAVEKAAAEGDAAVAEARAALAAAIESSQEIDRRTQEETQKALDDARALSDEALKKFRNVFVRENALRKSLNEELGAAQKEV